MIALAAGAVVLSATLQSLHFFQVQLSAQQESAARQQDARIGLQVMEAELRLAGTGSAAQEGAVLQAGPDAITFLANLDGLATELTSAVSGTEEDLSVKDGADWPKGKRLLVCREDRCAEGRLARAGRRGTLTLTAPLGLAFPQGSAVFVSNQVRYYLGKDGRGAPAVMRQVDGGASPLVADVLRFRLRYVDRRGTPTGDPAQVARVRLEMAVGRGAALVGEVGLRAKLGAWPAGSGTT